MLNLYHELIGRSEECERKKYLIVGDNILDKVLDNIKEIKCIEKFDNSKILIDTDVRCAIWYWSLFGVCMVV